MAPHRKVNNRSGQSSPETEPEAASFHRAVTFRSLGISLLAMVVMFCVMVFTVAIAGVTTGGRSTELGEEVIAFTAIWTIVALTVAGAVLYAATRLRLLSRAELFFVFFTVFIGSPLMAHGFWNFMLSRVIGIPWSSDFEKLEAFPDKMWPHGPNLTAGLLEFEGNEQLAGKGGFSWTEAEIDAGVWERVPTLGNAREKEVSQFRVPVAITPSDRAPLILGQPHMLSVLVRARDLGSDAFYYCHLHFDEEAEKGESLFSGRGSTKKTVIHRTGFKRVGLDGLTFYGSPNRNFVLEFGLDGPGVVEFRDLKLINVSAMREAYEGRKVLTEADFNALAEDQRGGQIARPDSLFSLRGLIFLLAAYLPLGDWGDTILAWSSLALLILAASFALSVIMRRQWVDHERFLLPMTRIPRFLLGMEDEEKDRAVPSFWGNKIMWAGMAITFTWCLLRAWSFSQPAVPSLSIDLNLASYFSHPRFGSMFQGVALTVSAMVVGLALFMELSVLASLVIGFWIFRSEFWIGEASGLTTVPGYPFGWPQVTGSFIAYFILILFFSRRYLQGIFKEAWHGSNQSGGSIFSPYLSSRFIFLRCRDPHLGRMAGNPKDRFDHNFCCLRLLFLCGSKVASGMRNPGDWLLSLPILLSHSICGRNRRPRSERCHVALNGPLNLQVGLFRHTGHWSGNAANRAGTTHPSTSYRSHRRGWSFWGNLHWRYHSPYHPLREWSGQL